MSALEVDLTTCDREPIHVPGAIQPFGVLLVVDAAGHLRRFSANAEALLGELPALGEPLAAPLRQALAPWLAVLAEGGADGFEPIELTAFGRLFDVIAHQHGAGLLVELEPRQADGPTAMSFALKAQKGLERVQRQRSTRALLEVATEELWHLTGFDRVMAYRFLHDESGHVVAERKRESLESFLGLRYPATDIPQQARRLFTLNRLRFIPDIEYQPVPIHPDSGPEAADPLDLSDSMLRSVSPIHVEYLRNMAVTGSMSISIVAGGKLWGLFACHHYSGARLVPHAVRVACALLAQVVSVMVERIEIEQRSAALDAARSLRQELCERARQAEDVVAALSAAPSFVELVEASGGAIAWERRVRRLGNAPGSEVIGQLVDWLDTTGQELVQTHELGRVAPSLAGVIDGMAGLLAVRFHREQDGWLLWFRPEEAETVRWAGNPEKSYSEGPHGQRLNPRGSFKEWRETVRGRAAPWQAHELEVAESFRRDLQEVALAKLSELERARDMMLAALGHDLRTPLGAISMAAKLLSGQAPSPSDLGQRIARSSTRMQRLIDQMLDVSRLQSGLGLGLQPTEGDLAALLRQALEEARLGYPGTELLVTLPEALPGSFDGDRIGQLFSNLLSNARHHGKLGKPVQVLLELVGQAAVLTVINHGGPIPAETRGRLFQPFKVESLQHRRNRSGLGLGLYIASEIAKAHGGRIELDDADGMVTFRVVLPLQRG